jgi:hypothetical protein
MTIIINQQLRDYIDPLTTHEYLALERSLLKEGCRDALVLWGETLIATAFAKNIASLFKPSKTINFRA